MSDLSTRIATALENPDTSSTELAGLIQAASKAAKDACESVDVLEAKLSDPFTPEADIAALSTELSAARLRRVRMSKALDLLRDRHERAVKREREAVQAEKRAAVLAKRDAFVAELRSEYPKHAGELVALIERMQALDAECGSVGIESAEGVARGLPSNGYVPAFPR